MKTSSALLTKIADLKAHLEAFQASCIDPARQEATIAELRTQSAADKALLVNSHWRVFRMELVVTAPRSRLVSLEVDLGNLASTSWKAAETYISIAVEDAQREAVAASEALVALYSAESAARQGLEAVMKSRIDETAKDFDRLVTRATKLCSAFHSENKTTYGSIDALINDLIDLWLLDISYEDSGRKDLLPAPIPVSRALGTRYECGGFEARGRIPLHLRTNNVRRGSSSQ